MNFFDSYFYKPNFFQKVLVYLLLPLSFIYAFFAILNTKFKKKVAFEVPIISVGNLSLGGNGKTPMCKAIAVFLQEFLPQQGLKEAKIFIVLRGYKRKSKGLICVKLSEKILCSVEQSGDEAMEYAFEKAIYGVIVSEDRVKGIQKALELGANIILLDDAFSKFYIKKFDLLLESRIKPYFKFSLPSGAYRLPPNYAKKADFIAIEDRDFVRYSYVKENQKAILIASIAKPFRLYEHFIKARACYFFKDHHDYKKSELENLLKKHNCDTLMLTFKDFVKVKDMGFKYELIKLELELMPSLKEALINYIKSFKNFDIKG
ncbi:tetraacyldisaccharide 4'-kinase [Campylobacter sp. MIT 97-5078]|uniref:tetraacyldisaccharide 4'-kinase n=1 Tax=Campylobacter sp. MIT 97-5078 TaxID=1548153 RepID=UPI000514817E|nr:tetraacyldisaccharide 4'-kinase [Campylobacter sp. MIT 97-5078]KGI57019.1 tetraacyldisaccharide 4'-kinase [Campylobacter sp. MIT 97-5078]TQR28150.1 tetraacyldisaccharide 4'-kinase [Campylobacter sp. MIT 97-5078]